MITRAKHKKEVAEFLEMVEEDKIESSGEFRKF